MSMSCSSLCQNVSRLFLGSFPCRVVKRKFLVNSTLLKPFSLPVLFDCLWYFVYHVGAVRTFLQWGEIFRFGRSLTRHLSRKTFCVHMLSVYPILFGYLILFSNIHIF